LLTAESTADSGTIAGSTLDVNQTMALPDWIESWGYLEYFEEADVRRITTSQLTFGLFRTNFGYSLEEHWFLESEQAAFLRAGCVASDASARAVLT
jgi:hypothetical protein